MLEQNKPAFIWETRSKIGPLKTGPISSDEAHFVKARPYCIQMRWRTIFRKLRGTKNQTSIKSYGFWQTLREAGICWDCWKLDLALGMGIISWCRLCFYGWWTPCHRALSIFKLLVAIGVQVLPWPTKLADLNPIENIREGQRVTNSPDLREKSTGCNNSVYLWLR